jgi:hypothetical protein
LARFDRHALGLGAPLLLAFCGGSRFEAPPESEPAGSGGVGRAGAAPTGGIAGSGGSSTSAGGERETPAGAPSSAGDTHTEGGMLSVPLEPTLVEISIEHDADDAWFYAGNDEQLSSTMEIGAVESSKIGLRFQLDIPKGSRIEHAELRLTRTGGTAADDDSLQIHIYESSNVPAFDDSHMHPPESHVAGGLWNEPVTGFQVGPIGEVTSPDLRTLIEHVLAREDSRESSRIGLILSAERMSGPAVFADSSLLEDATALTISYIPPR